MTADTTDTFFRVNTLNNPATSHDELVLGRRKLSAIFDNSRPLTLKADEILGAVGSASKAICRLRAGWACHFRDLSNDRRAIVDVYLPGDVIGLDAVFGARQLEDVLTLTALTIEVSAKDALLPLMADRPSALYIAWLLSQRERRADRVLAGISSL